MRNYFPFQFAVLSLSLLLCSFVLASCGDDGTEGTKGLKGWYIDLNNVAKASDFDKLNEAIRNNEVLSSYSYGGQRHDYVASRDLFIVDGRYNDTNAYFGRLRYSIDMVVNAIHVVDDSTMAMYNAWLYEDGAGSGEEVYKLYAGSIFGNMTYYCSSPVYYTYVKADNKLIVSNGDIYTVTSGGGLIADGSSALMSKYDPSKRY